MQDEKTAGESKIKEKSWKGRRTTVWNSGTAAWEN